MSNLFTMLPFAVNNPNLPVVPAIDYERLSEIEVGAYDHWIFDRGASGLVGRLNGKTLTAQSDLPVYASSYLSISGNEGKALLSGLGEAAGQTDTIAVVFKYNNTATGVVVPFGTIGKNADPAPISGGSPFKGNAVSDLLLTYRGAVSSADTTDNLVWGQWLFLCVSRQLTTSGSVRTLLGGSTVRSITGNYSSYVPAASGRKIALGSAYYNSQVGNTLDFAEAVIFNHALSANDMQALYLRTKARMAARGITVV